MKRVLLIDDEKNVMESMTDVIEAMGKEVRSYSSIEEAMRSEELALMDLVLCDIGLSGENAFDFARDVKAKYKDLPFVILSAFSDEEVVKRGLDAGADKYLIKPASLKDLREVFDSFL